MELNTKQLQKTYNISVATWKRQEDKISFLQSLGIEAVAEKQGRSIIYTIINDEEYNELRTIKEVLEINLKAEELEDFKYVLRVWLSGTIRTNRQLAEDLGQSKDRVDYWRRQLNDIGLLQGQDKHEGKFFLLDNESGEYDEAKEEHLAVFFNLLEETNSWRLAQFKFRGKFGKMFIRLYPAKVSILVRDINKVFELL